MMGPILLLSLFLLTLCLPSLYRSWLFHREATRQFDAIGEATRNRINEWKRLIDAEFKRDLQRKHDAHLATLFADGKPKP